MSLGCWRVGHCLRAEWQDLPCQTLAGSVSLALSAH